MRRGAALPTVLLTVALSSALAVGTAYTSRQIAATVRFSARAVRLQPRADAALAVALATWDSSARSAQPIGATVALATIPLDSADLWVTRLTETIYLVVAEVRADQRPELRRRSGVLTTTYSGAPQLLIGYAWFELP